MKEPALKTIAQGGKLNLAMLGRIIRRVERLHGRIDSVLGNRAHPGEPSLTEPSGKLRLDSVWLGRLLRRIENAGAEINNAGFLAGDGTSQEPPLNVNATRGTLTLAALNRIIRRIEYLYSLQISDSGSGPYYP